MARPFEHVVIVGCGLLGTSLGLALASRGLARVITGVGRKGSTSVDVAHRRGAIHRATDDPALAVQAGKLDGIIAPAADLVVVCVPIRQFPELFRTIGPALSPGAIVTDVGSTKSQIMRWAVEFLPAGVDFVGSHPMAGSEKTGPEAAREGLYHHAVCLLCRPEKETPSSVRAAARVTEMWQSIGMRVTDSTADEHDRRVAAVSHLPHALAFTLMQAAGREPAALEAAAGGFTDMTRIASSDPTMWTDIFLTNREAVLHAVANFSAELAAFKAAIENGDEGAIRNYLVAAKGTRDAFMQRRTTSASTNAFGRES